MACLGAVERVAPGKCSSREDRVNPEDLVQKLQQTLGSGLRSVVLYGSAAAGDYVGKRSDYNILVVVNTLGVKELTALSKPSAAWRRSGNPAPLFFTLDRLKKSVDVFPIEVLDIKESHRILFGEDVIEELDVHRENLRLVLEHELKSTLIRLREDFLLTQGKPKRIQSLMVDSLSTVLVLFRAALRLYQEAVPPLKIDAMKALATHIAFNQDVFESIENIKEGRRIQGDLNPIELFDTYLRTVESVVDSVDTHVHR